MNHLYCSLLCIVAVCLFFVGCGDTGQAPIRVPIEAVGVEGAASFLSADGWQVQLTQARVGLGPIYFCATQAASADLCPAAVAEFAGSGVVDALSGAVQPLGVLEGFEGEVRSATYDFAYPWLLTQNQPTPLPSAPEGHSAYFEGEATKDGRRVRFVAGVDAKPQLQGLRVVQGARTQTKLSASGSITLQIHVDVSAWWRSVDFDALAEDAELAGGDVFVLEPDSRAINAVITGMTAISQPHFVWMTN